MVLAPPPLPTQFPCWCRAVYSWGGESKHDLGFMEGELIECLNAGDGSWWVGRLFRDRRTVGSFPSNFVEVLPPDFRPTTRTVSPLTNSNTPSPKNVPAKSKTFRKPFEAYAKAPHYTSAKQPVVYRDVPKAAPAPAPGQPSRSRETSANSVTNSVRDVAGRGHSPSPHAYNRRDHSPAPPQRQYHPNISRAHSPSPSFQQPHMSSHGHYERQSSPPPPAPPPHRHVARSGSDLSYNPPQLPRHGSHDSYGHPDLSRQGSNASYNPLALSRQGSHASYTPYRPGAEVLETPKAPSPDPLSPAGSHMTPSPLREAMDGVMEQLGQLGGLGGKRLTESPEPPLDPWSPESFNMVGKNSRRKARENVRPLTSMGIAHADEGYETWSGGSSQEASYQGGQRENDHDLPQLSSYVERMEKRLQKMHQHSMSTSDADDRPPAPPPKGHQIERPKSSMGDSVVSERKLRSRKSAYEIGRGVARTFTTKTNSTNASSGNQSNTSASTASSGRTLWSGASASGFSATSAGSLARTAQRAQSALGLRDSEADRPESPFTGVTYHSSHASNFNPAARPMSQAGLHDDGIAGLGGLVQPKAPKRNIFKKIFDSAKTGVASTRGSIAAGTMESMKSNSPFARSMPPGTAAAVSTPMTAIGNSPFNRDPARDMGLGGGVDWVQVRRDVNRSNSLSKNERTERQERCLMLDHPALNPVDELYEGVEGDEGADGMPVQEPVNYQAINLSQVDKNSRFIAGPTPGMTSVTLATSYVCRPYRSDVQRLRAIFTWVAEKICWEEDFEGVVDTRRVIEAQRACAEEYAVLVMEMCGAVGIHCELIRGYLKPPGEVPDLNMMPRSNHWWNAVVVDNEWRIIDCCLASPSNPRRSLYSSASNTSADYWWFLTRPLEACWTHVPEHHDQQHIVPPVAHEILLNLPCTCPPFFRNEFEMVDYNTSVTRIEDLEMVHVKFNVPADVEVAAEVEARAYARDSDGDVFESGEVVKKRALAQAEWFNGMKRYTVKAVLPGDEGQGILKIYAGKRGLMHSIKDIPHPLAFALPIIHTGENPPYEFVTRHPTPHAQRHDIYIVQPQCQRLALNNTFVFAVRQHPSSLESSLTPSSNPGGTSPIPFTRPGSAMSMNASSVSGSNPSSASGTVAGKKPAKLAIQTPGGKILRLMRKEDRRGISVGSRGFTSDEEVSDGGTWETIIKCSEKGVWRGLVLADRTARWCVFAEWVCVG
ncbi:putative SH3-domain protein Cyk3 [Stachybotrys elegans]|uniref:SH3-domain protein Cyk3 n=1 Tax=Stachybotrys elegans TaxID=80388 RepID=A0A8K0SUZ6_9HYPO|nr:putative SH3-domain protein Cyk3 [Stachybotrys elegans]